MQHYLLKKSIFLAMFHVLSLHEIFNTAISANDVLATEHSYKQIAITNIFLNIHPMFEINTSSGF